MNHLKMIHNLIWFVFSAPSHPFILRNCVHDVTISQNLKDSYTNELLILMLKHKFDLFALLKFKDTDTYSFGESTPMSFVCAEDGIRT